MGKSNNDRNKLRNLELVKDDRWKKKGHSHKESTLSINICYYCSGLGYVDSLPCPKCDGDGTILNEEN